MTIKLGVVMDPISAIHIKKDTTFAMLLEAQRRGWEIYYMEMQDLFLEQGRVSARMRRLTVQEDVQHWFDFGVEQTQALQQLDVILMRKDPPFDMQYIYATYLLELAETQGVLVVNKPSSLRDANEKLFTAWFPQCCPETLVTSDGKRLRQFIQQHKDVILKPLDGMGGFSIFRVSSGDLNTSVIIETLTQMNSRAIMAQRFIPEIDQGDKRILMVNGEPVPYALARIPAAGELRGNLAAGGMGVGVKLSARDHWICQQIGPILREKGLLFVGLDVIGDYLTEINVTSPTCARELDAEFGINISGQFLDCVKEKLAKEI